MSEPLNPAGLGWARYAAWGLLLLVLYILSYAPFLRFSGDSWSPYYRAPAVYRPVEWIMLRTPLKASLLEWSTYCGVRDRCEFQVWYFAQGISDPTNEIHFNIQAE